MKRVLGLLILLTTVVAGCMGGSSDGLPMYPGAQVHPKAMDMGQYTIYQRRLVTPDEYKQVIAFYTEKLADRGLTMKGGSEAAVWKDANMKMTRDGMARPVDKSKPGYHVMVMDGEGAVHIELVWSKPKT